ncbi:UNVERIFIED_CONTAM: hypothetical protein FKN15_033352 [Acipenser sinensis]
MQGRDGNASWKYLDGTIRPSALCGQREYFLVHTVKNADEAREHCRSLYTDLVSITSQDVLLDIEQLMNKTTSNIDYWIGLRRDGPSALCGQREYFLVHTVKNADEAREHCRSLYTDLVSITSQDVLLDIEQLMNKDTSNIDYWIGLRRNGRSWGWGNGETFNYSNWGETWSTSDCVTIKTSDWNFGTWQVNNCTDNNKFICYKGKSLLSYRDALDQLPAQNVSFLTC